MRDAATRTELHTFLRTCLPPDRFPTLVALGEHVWVDNCDKRFTSSLTAILHGLDTARPGRRSAA